MTQSKRPDRVELWTSSLQSWLRENTPQRVDMGPPPDAFSESVDAMVLIPVGDRKSYAVATCLYKLGSFATQAPLLRQRVVGDTRTFELVHVATGAVVSEDVAGTGLGELVSFPKGRWVTELRISLVVRLHRVGFTNPEIARLLPNGDQRSPADVRRDAKAIAMLLEKHKDGARPDLAYSPATWPLRVP